MAYKLEKPCDENKLADFVVMYNHRMGLMIEETPIAYYALEENEIMQDDKPIIDVDFEAKQTKLREEKFKSEFFLTSLGWIRRKVNMKDGSTKDFLTDLLLPIKAGLELGQGVNETSKLDNQHTSTVGNGVEIITYKTPDFTLDYTDEYIISLQERKQATAQFIQECLARMVADFSGD